WCWPNRRGGGRRRDRRGPAYPGHETPVAALHRGPAPGGRPPGRGVVVGHGLRQVAAGPAGGGEVVAEQLLLTTDRHQRREAADEHTSELQSRENIVCRLLLEKK